MAGIIKIKVNNQISVQLDGSNMFIYINGQLWYSGFEKSIDYLESHRYFNDINNKEFNTILKAFQNYYATNILQKSKQEQLINKITMCYAHYKFEP